MLFVIQRQTAKVAGDEWL